MSLGCRDSDREIRSIRKGTPGHNDSGALQRCRIEIVKGRKGVFLKRGNTYKDSEQNYLGSDPYPVDGGLSEGGGGFVDSPDRFVEKLKLQCGGGKLLVKKYGKGKGKERGRGMMSAR